MAGPPERPDGLRTVGEVSELATVSVRTLHHYDEVGLLRPADRTEAGHRLYGRSELKMFEGFEDFDHAAHAAEAEERWGGTEAYRESARRTAGYGRE